MGLREKVALATVAVIAAQIVCSHCMPRSLPHCSVKSHISSLISPKADSIREFKTNRKLKKNSYNNILNGNSSQVLQLPNVKEPSDFEAGRYYRFYCDYLHEPKKLSETQFQTRNFKREAKQKRNLDLRDKRPLPIKSSGLARESPPQPYCFRKSSFFPEVEYPLSARDMWIPKYWSQLLDAEVPRNVKTDAPINQNEQKNTKPTYLSYENSPLHDIIKTLNNHNTGKIDHSNLGEFIPKTSEDKSIHDGIYPYQYPNTSTTVPPDYTAPDIHSGVLPHTKMTIEAYPVPETASTSSPGPPVTSATPTLPNIPATIASVTSSDLRNIDFDIIGATTTLPFDDFTSPITESIASADNFTLLPTTVKSMQTQEREASLSETNIEPTVTPELVPFLISSTVKKPEQELRDHTTPTQSTTMSPMKSSDVINSDFNEIGVSTASPSDLFTSPVTQSIASADNLISLPNTIASMQTQEQGASRSDTNIEPTATPELVSFISSTEKNPEQQLKDYTTPIQSTTLSPKKSSDVIYSDFDEIGASTVSPSDLLTSPVTQSLASADNFISLPTTIASVQTQERQTSLSETNTESSATPKLQSLISSSEKIPEQQLKDQTTPMQSATLPSTKKSNFDKFHVSTTSPSDVFTSLITHSETLADSFISHTQTEKIPTPLSTVISNRDKEGELRLSETDIKPTTTSPLLYFGSTVENKTEEKIMDYTTRMRSTPNFKFYSDNKASLTDSISFSSNSSDLVPSSNVVLENTNIVNNVLDTNKPLLKHDVVKNEVDVKQPSIPSSSIATLNNLSHSADFSFPENPNQLDTFQGQVVGYYYENLTNDDILQLCTSPRSNSSIIFTDDYKDNWVYSPNDSYITWESTPECSDECFIFVDTENPASSTVICNNNNLNIPSKPEVPVITESKYSGDVRKNVTSIPDSLAHIAAIEKNKSEEMPKIALDNIYKLNLTNLPENTEVKSIQNPQENRTKKYPVGNELRVLDNGTIADSVSVADNADSTILKSPKTLLSENVDETWASYTEIPYDSLVLYDNETWTANGNEYALYQQMSSADSDDTTQFFLDTEKLSGLLNDIIINTN